MADHTDIVPDKDPNHEAALRKQTDRNYLQMPLETSCSDDIASEAAESLFGDGDPSTPPGSPIFIMDEFICNTRPTATGATATEP